MQKQRLYAIVKTTEGIRTSTQHQDHLEDIGIYNDITFYLYAIQDDDFLEIPALLRKRM